MGRTDKAIAARKANALARREAKERERLADMLQRHALGTLTEQQARGAVNLAHGLRENGDERLLTQSDSAPGDCAPERVEFVLPTGADVPTDSQQAATVGQTVKLLTLEALHVQAGMMRNPRVAPNVRLSAAQKIFTTGLELLGLIGKPNSQQQPATADAQVLAALSAAVQRRKQAAQAVDVVPTVPKS